MFVFCLLFSPRKFKMRVVSSYFLNESAFPVASPWLCAAPLVLCVPVSVSPTTLCF